MNTRRTATVSRRIDAPVHQVWAHLVDTATWTLWSPLPDRTPVQVRATSPDAPYWVRLHVTTGGGRHSHTGDVTLAPLADGGTFVAWRATLSAGWPDLTGRRRARLERVAASLAAHLASYAEDLPTTRRAHAAATSAPLSPPAPRAASMAA